MSQSELATTNRSSLASAPRATSRFDQVWPAAVVAFGLIVNVAWIAALGYGLVALITLAVER